LFYLIGALSAREERGDGRLLRRE